MVGKFLRIQQVVTSLMYITPCPSVSQSVVNIFLDSSVWQHRLICNHTRSNTLSQHLLPFIYCTLCAVPLTYHLPPPT